MPRDVLALKNRRIAAGESDRTLTLPTTLADKDLRVTLAVDDPAADPPTPADLIVHVDADRDGAWFPVATIVVGASCEATHFLPTRSRTLRVRWSCGIACVVDLTATAYP